MLRHQKLHRQPLLQQQQPQPQQPQQPQPPSQQQQQQQQQQQRKQQQQQRRQRQRQRISGTLQSILIVSMRRSLLGTEYAMTKQTRRNVNTMEATVVYRKPRRFGAPFANVT